MGLGSVLSTALSGISAAETAVSALANNLANLNTDGYKQSFPVYSSQPPQTYSLGAAPTAQTGGSNPVQVGRGVQTAAITTDFSQGSIVVDSDPLHLALEGDGFFIVEGPQGEHLYTRDGNFRLNADRELVTAEGYRVLGYSVDEEYHIREGELEPLRIPEGVQVESDSGVALMTGFNIDRDGRIRARFSDGTVRDFGQVRVARFANPSGLERRGRNLYAIGPNSGLPVEGNPASRGTAAIIAGARERSNTDIGRNLIGLARASLQFRASLAVFRETDRLYGELINLRRPA